MVLHSLGKIILCSNMVLIPHSLFCWFNVAEPNSSCTIKFEFLVQTEDPWFSPILPKLGD